MIDIFTVVVPHALMALAVWRLLHCEDLDNDPALPNRKPSLVRPKRTAGQSSGRPEGGAPRA